VDLSFKIKEIPQAGAPQRLQRLLPAALISAALEGEEGDASASKLRLEVELFRDHEDVIVRGRLRGHLVLACGRCVEPAQVNIDVPVDAMFTREGSEVEEPADVEALLAAPDGFFHDGVVIKLDEAVREMLVAELPISPLCSPGCLGLCPVCGANRNTPEGQACGHVAPEPPPEGPGGLAALANIKLAKPKISS